jgi:iron uptake system component EfeO
VSRSARLAPRLASIGLLAGTVLALAACGGGSAEPAPATPVASGVVTVEAKEYAFTPSALSAPAGTVTFSVKNAGNEEHEFEIFKGETVVDEIEGLVPGLIKDLTVTLAPGDYTFFCKLNGHDQLGMKGTIAITGG